MIEILLILNLITLLGIAFVIFRLLTESKIAHKFRAEVRKSFDTIGIIEGNIFRKNEKRFDDIDEKLKTPITRSKNDIEKKEVDEVDITEEFRIPVGMPGLKVKFEGDDMLKDGQ